MALSELDRKLLHRCLAQAPQAWEDFVDRFLGLVMHVVEHTGRVRSLQLSLQDREDLVAEVFYTLVADDFRVLRRFKEQSSLATYLTVVARRVVVREVMRRRLGEAIVQPTDDEYADSYQSEDDIDSEHISRLIDRLAPAEAMIVKLFHLDGKSYEEISRETGVPENSIGPTLSRARAKLRQMMASS